MNTAVSNLPANAYVSPLFSESQRSIGKENVPDQPVSELIDLLTLKNKIDLLILKNNGEFDPVVVRNVLRSHLQAMTPDGRNQLITCLEKLAEDDVGEEVKDLLESKLPAVKEEAENGWGIDHLVELLFLLYIVLGKANTERRNSAASLAEVSTLQAKASGENGINGAFANLTGSVVGAGLAVGVAGGGFAKYSKGTNGQIKNIQTNVRDVDRNRQMNADLNNALRRPVEPLSGNSPQERLKTLDTANGKVSIAPNQPNLTSEEQHTLQQLANRNEVTAAAQDASRRENEFVFSRDQAAGQTTMAIAQHMAPIGQTGFGIQAASANAQAKVNDAEAAVASTAQHSDEQAVQRLVDLLTKIFMLITSVSDSNNQVSSEIVRSIRG